MRSQGWDCSHFTDVDSKAERGKATSPKSHSCSAAEPGLMDQLFLELPVFWIFRAQAEGWHIYPGMGGVVEEGISPFGF